MRIRIDPEVSAGACWFPILDVISLFVEQGRHRFDPESLDPLLASAWIAQRRDAAETLRAADRAASPHPGRDAVVLVVREQVPPGGSSDRSRQEIHVNPLDALRLLTTPFFLVVENEPNDGAFVLWMAAALGKQKLIESYRQGCWAFRHAGGKDSVAKSAEVLSLGVWPDRARGRILAMDLRVAAMIDSDACYPGHAPNAERIREAAEHTAFAFVLTRRAIENYIPLRWLEKYTERDGSMRRAGEAFKRLNPEQRRYFNMKSGFRKRKEEQDKVAFLADRGREESEKELFRSVPESVWDTVKSGFGRGLSSIYSDEACRPDVGTKSERDQTLSDELSRLLDDIYRYI